MGNELSVAEITQITGMPQSRVSTHLAKLREAGVLRDRHEGASTYYASTSDHARAGTAPVESGRPKLATKPLLRADRARCQDILRAREKPGKLARVRGRTDGSPLLAGPDLGGDHAGLSALHSPGRRARRGLGRRHHGRLAGLALPSVTCLDRSEKVLQAARQRLSGFGNVAFALGDLHALPFPDGRFDHVLLLNVLTYTKDPALVLREAARVLRPGGDLTSAPWPITRTRTRPRPTGT
jgi:SAM-dependent methyltransferase